MCRSMPAVSRRSTLPRPTAPSSTPAIRARLPVVPPRWRSASWRQCSGRWDRRSRSASSRRRPAPAAISDLGATIPRRTGIYIMYLFSGGGYGGWWHTDGLTNGCSSVGISETQPVEILEQHYPIVFDRFALREGSGGAGRRRGGFGIDYQIRLLRGEAKASFLMDHGRVGPPGLLGGSPGAVKRLPSARPTWFLLRRISRRVKVTCWPAEIRLPSRRRAAADMGPPRSVTPRWWNATSPEVITPL